MRQREEDGNEWTVTSADSVIKEKNMTFGPHSVSTSIYTVKIVVRRQDMFYMLVFIIPCYFLTFLSYAPYLMPPQTAAHKCVIPISILLSYNIYVLLLERLMPKTSDLPVLGESEVFRLSKVHKTFLEFLNLRKDSDRFVEIKSKFGCIIGVIFASFSNLFFRRDVLRYPHGTLCLH